VILWTRHELPPPMAIGAAIDLVLGILFLTAFARTQPLPSVAAAAADA
jgi:hypothetical protein